MNKPEGGTAFPSPYDMTKDGKLIFTQGMMLRDYFAAQAMAGVVSDPEMDLTVKELAVYCYKCADAMIEQRDAKS